MAGMRGFVLCGEIVSAYCDALATDDCLSSQIAIVAASAVPLWKVIVGPRAGELNRTRKGPVFFAPEECIKSRVSWLAKGERNRGEHALRGIIGASPRCPSPLAVEAVPASGGW